MSLKENLKNIKQEFDQDEKMLESAFRLEILARRYRRYIAAGIICLLALGIGYGVYNYMDSQRTKQATQAYAKLLEDVTDEQALKSLAQASPELYDLYRYGNANGDSEVFKSLLHSKNELVRTLAAYEIASINAGEANEKGQLDISGLDKVKASALKDLALLQEAFLLFSHSSIQEAKDKLLLIPDNSILREEAQMMRHYK